jgi:3-deoxy-D-manno-octulosonate cytidylyltransferase
MSAAIVIPVRLASTRLPGKPLALLGELPLVNWVVRQCRRANSASDVFVATDSAEIEEALQAEDCRVIQTNPEHQSGSDRVAEVAMGLKHDFIINVQGDEPFVSPSDIDAVIAALNEFGHDVVTLRTQAEAHEIDNPNAVKIALGHEDRALYFSRAPIPCRHPSRSIDPTMYWRHIGLYGYRREALLKWAALPKDRLENYEGLEQLRALSHGMTIQAIPANSPSRGIDTPDDLQWARERVDKLGAQAFPN